MNEIVAFLSQHWILSTVFVFILLAFLVNELLQDKLGLRKISAEEAVQIMNHDEGLIVDVRSEKSFSEGHILGAHNLPQDQIATKLNTLQKWKNKTIIVVCAMGQASQKAGAALKAAGFQVQILKDGIQAWKTAGLPVVRK